MRRIRMRIFAHEDTYCGVIEYGIAFSGIAVIERHAEKVRVVLEMRGQVETQLPAKEQLVVVDGQWVAPRQAGNGLVQSIRCHGNEIDIRPQVCELLRFLKRIVTV